MPQKLLNLNPQDVQNNLEIMKQMLQEAHPEITTDRGPFHDLVLYYAAMYTTANQKDILDALRCVNIGKLLEDPENTHPALVDRVAANWMTRRRKGARGTGNITLMMTTPQNFILPAGSKFTANGHVFKTKETYHVRANAAHLTTNDRLLAYKGCNHFEFNVPVVSVETGNASNLKKGTQLRHDITTFPYVHRVFAAHDFVTGAGDEDNTQVLNRMQKGFSGRVLSNRCTYDTLIAQNQDFADVVAISVVGFGDPEMTRDQNGIWPGSLGGCVDVYVKTKTDCADTITAIQEFVSAPSVSSLSSDILVKQAVRCNVKVKIVLERNQYNQIVNDNEVKEVVCGFVNGTGFCNQLSATAILEKLAPYLRNRCSLRDISVGGQIKTKDSTIDLEFTKLLTIPDKPDLLITPRTTVFFAAHADISVTVVSMD